MQKLLTTLDHLQQYKLLQVFTIYLRYLIGATFVFAFTWKTGTLMDYDPANLKENELNPTFVFQSIMRIKPLWIAVAWTQLIGGALMCTQRFATIGTLLLYPVVFCILLMTWYVGFMGTKEIMLFVFLGMNYLLIWDLKKLWPLFQRTDRLKITGPSSNAFMHHRWWVIVGLFLAVFSFSHWWFHNILWWLLGCFFIGLMGLVLFPFFFPRK